MTALIFLRMAIAMMTASAGYRGTAIGLFGVSFVAAILWFDRYAIETCHVPGIVLMENVGRGAADVISALGARPHGNLLAAARAQGLLP